MLVVGYSLLTVQLHRGTVILYRPVGSAETGQELWGDGEADVSIHLSICASIDLLDRCLDHYIVK